MAFFMARTFLFALATAPSSLAITNPTGFLLTDGFADPRTTYWDGVFYGFATYNASQPPYHKVPVATSKGFAYGWNYSTADVLPIGPSWANGTGTYPHVWDPMLHVYNATHFVLYYAALSSTKGPGGEDRHCIGTAVATTPLGPYTPAEEPLMCGAAEGVQYIASYPFTYGEPESPYILWNRQTTVQDSSVQVTQLSTDGLSLVGDTTTLLAGTPSDYTVEGGAMIFNPNADGHPILIFVTGNFDNITYEIQYAVAPTNALIPPSGQQYVPNPTPLLRSSGTYNGQKTYGPGGPCFPRPYDVPTEMTFMADPNGTDVDGVDPSYLYRSMRAVTLAFGSDNTVSVS